MVSEEKTGLIAMHFHEERRLRHVLYGGDSDVIIRDISCTVLPVKNETEPVKDVRARNLSDVLVHS